MTHPFPARRASDHWPVLPDCAGADHCITSNEVFHLEEFPQRMVVMGGGYIAVEFAGVFNALGSKVTLVNRSETILRSYEQGVVERLDRKSTRLNSSH